jgi:hypothetical protein
VPLGAPTLADPADEYYFRSESPPVESLDNLPIASRFLSTNPILRQQAPTNPPSQPPSGSRTPTIPADGESVVSDEEEDQIGRGYAPGKNKLPVRGASSQNSPYGTSVLRSLGKNLPFPSRSHHSLPPPPRPNPQASTTSLGRQSVILGYDGDHQASAFMSSGRSKKASKKGSSSMTLPNDAPLNPNPGSGLAPHLLPEDLRQCLEVLEASILKGHITLSEGLKKRYEEQYPLVRSLADVFVSNVSGGSY